MTTDTELTSLLVVSRAASSSLEVEPFLDVLLDQLKSVVDYQLVAVYAALDDEGPPAAGRVLAQRGSLQHEQVLQRGSVPFSTEQRQAMEDQRPVIGQAVLDVPLIACGRSVGVLELVHDVPGFYSPRHAEVALAFAQHAAAAIDHTSIYRHAERLAASEIQERRAVEARYRGLFLGAADAILITAPGGQVLEVNPAAVDLLGWQQEELVGRAGPEMLAAEPDAPVDYSSLRRSGRWEGEVNLRRKDGTIVPTWIRSTLVELPDGPIFVSAMRDVSDRRREADILEQRVVERTHELSALLDVARDMSSTLELRALLNSMLDQLKSIVEYDQMTVQLRLDNGQWRIFEYRGPVPRELLVGEIMPAEYHAKHRELELRGEPILRSYLGEDLPVVRRLRGEGVDMPANMAKLNTSQLIAPLFVKGVLKGSIVLLHQRPGYYTQHHARLVMAFAQQAAVAIENARLYEAVRSAAALEERQRLARELHDSVSQALYAIALNTTAAQEGLRDADASGSHKRTTRLLREVRRLARAGLAEMRALIFELRPESLQEEGLTGALSKQAAAAQARYGLRVKLVMCAEPAVSLAVKEVMHRIAQEALQNVIKHAHTRNVEVLLETHDHQLALNVRDWGRGFATDAVFPGHLGLRSMRERAEGLGGTLAVSSAAGEGTVVRACVPLAEQSSATDSSYLP